jgi:hypothetical protein
MEVHHHAHTERKKWTHYLWEFFMLFLAVTLGFLVENLREDYKDHQRERQFMTSLINDVKADTILMHKIIRSRDEREKMFDSLSLLLDQGPPYDSTNMIYFYGVVVPRNLAVRFIPYDGTLQQLKNSGGLRLIRNQRVVDSITRYDVSLKNLTQFGEIELTAMHDFRTIAHRFFNSRVLDKMMSADNIPSPPTDNPPLIPFSKNDLNEFNYKLFNVKGMNRASRVVIKLVLRQAESLLAMLKKEYHL